MERNIVRPPRRNGARVDSIIGERPRVADAASNRRELAEPAERHPREATGDATRVLQHEIERRVRPALRAGEAYEVVHVTREGRKSAHEADEQDARRVRVHGPTLVP